MSVVIVSLVFALAITNIVGHLFSRHSVVETTIPTPEDERHAALAKLVRTSENAIVWIGNKTASSLNGFFNLDQTSGGRGETASHHPLAAKTKQLLSWLKDKFLVNNSNSPEGREDSHSEDSAEDSGESLILAHRTPDRGFAWGPPQVNASKEMSSANNSESLMSVAKHRIQDFLSFLYNGTKSLTARSKTLIHTGVSKAFSKKHPFLVRQNATPPIEQLLENIEKNNGTWVEDRCDGTMRPVCAVDGINRYTVFLNECEMVNFNFEYGTNFSLRSDDVCMRLFAQHPHLFYQRPDP